MRRALCRFRPEGQTWLSATVCCIGNSLHGRTRFSYIVENITTRKQLEEQIEQLEGHLRFLTNRVAFTTIDITLRDDAKFSDGSPVTADDVVH